MAKQHVIVLGNEKGGTGKSTVGMHIIVSLLDLGFKVGSIDVDARQGTLTRYINNRLKSSENSSDKPLPMPEHKSIIASSMANKEEAMNDELSRFNEIINSFNSFDFIVIDTPGNDTYLSRLAHEHADTLITPLNDSFIDLDMLVQVDSKMSILRPSIYSEMVWEQRKAKARRDGGSIDWIVMRNRLSTIGSRNKEGMEQVLQALSKRIGFRVADGFCERVIFKELFLSGLTLLDLSNAGIQLSLSHISARQELRSLLKMIKIPSQEKLVA